MTWEIHQKDAIEGLRGLEGASIDLMCTDPPYDTLERHRARGTTTRLKKSKSSSNEWFDTVDADYFGRFFQEAFRVMKPGTDVYVMGNEEASEFIKPAMRNAGFEMRKSIVWWKVGKKTTVECPHCGKTSAHTHQMGRPGMGYPMRSCWEMIMLGRKGRRPKPDDLSVRNVQPVPVDVIEAPAVLKRGAYPTEKPVELLELLVRQSSAKGETVLDPFAGSGSTAEAARRNGRFFLGFDTSESAIESFGSRMSRWR